MKKKVVKEARRLMNKEIGAKIDETFLNSVFDEKFSFYFIGYVDALFEAGIISGVLSEYLKYAFYETWRYEEPEPEKKISYTVVWKWKTAKTENVIDGYRDSYSAWHTVKDLEKKFGDGLEYMYMIEEVEK